MNETIKTILSRRSFRSYLNEQIKAEDLELIIKAGLYSPSAKNEQSWHFTVIQDKSLIDNLSQASKLEMLNCDEPYSKQIGGNEGYHLFYHSPTVIVISGEKSATAPHLDCAAATENMLIAAESLNIGTCWIGLVRYLFGSDRANEYINLLQVPEGYEPFYAIAMGYKTSENPQPKLRRENTGNYIR